MTIEEAAKDLEQAINAVDESGCVPVKVTARPANGHVEVCIDFGAEGYTFAACQPQHVRQHFAEGLRELADAILPVR